MVMLALDVLLLLNLGAITGCLIMLSVREAYPRRLQDVRKRLDDRLDAEWIVQNRV